MTDSRVTRMALVQRHESALKEDGRNRAARAFWQGLGIDVLISIAVLVPTSLASAKGWGDVQWVVLSFLFAKTVLISAASYVMRVFLDKRTGVLLPPAPQPQPAEPASSPAPTVTNAILAGDKGSGSTVAEPAPGSLDNP